MNTELNEAKFFQNLSNMIAEKVEKQVSHMIKEEIKNYSVESKIPPYLNTSEFYELTGISHKKQSYLRKTAQIAYSKNGRSITYKREDVEEFLDTHRVPKKM